MTLSVHEPGASVWPSLLRSTEEGLVLHPMYFVSELHKATRACGRPKKDSAQRKCNRQSV
ncbi:MAG: hypothetical protein QOJ99_2822 [Bryobacterales bacterium]|jgi:hypothetical protein|nr:hypothetical protein [Bryobacterales bacterium]